ncbi:MAG: ethanolamine ammonia-lyase subunit EutC [Myxococcaceae bacterium]|nr:ethanolamine ammonia-lyase subunit EutC [Myxococcaceae bacterium]
MDKAAIEALVRQAVQDALAKGAEANAPKAAEPCCDGDNCKPRVVKPPPVRDPDALRKLAQSTPARIVQGRTGTRYLTKVYVGIRAEHAIALDAVHSAVPPEFAASLGALALTTQADDKEDYLLFPDKGRRLSAESKALLEKEATKGVDVQVIAADGLSAWAILRQGQALVPALVKELSAKGLSVGRPLFVTHARIGVQDEIGVLTQARSTVILVGERPGLGTGDSLSLYTAYKPRLNQDNAEKNCISNVRPLGLPPEKAARACAELMRKTFDAGGGGVHLVRPQRDLVVRG